MFSHESFWNGVASVMTHIMFCEEMVRLFDDCPIRQDEWRENLAGWERLLDWRLGFSDEYPL